MNAVHPVEREEHTMPDHHVDAQRADREDSRGRPGMLGGMREATRMTRAGRLSEATALIQRTLRARTSGPGAPQPGPTPPPPVRPAGRALAPGSPVARTTDRKAEPAATHRPHTEPARGGRAVTATHHGAAGSRDYRLYVPPPLAGTPRPLLVMLHGCSQDADDFAAGTGMDTLARDRGFVVVYPEQSQRSNPSRCWNWFRAGDQSREVGEPAIIAGITREVAAAHDIDTRRIYVAGMSAGAAMAVILGTTHPDLYAAVGAHSGLAYGAASDLPSALQAMKRGGGARPVGADVTPTIVFHGDQDRTVHRSNGDDVLRPWGDGGDRASTDVRRSVHQDRVPGGHAYTRAVYRDARGHVLAEGWSVHGLGHAWSGGDRSGSYTDPRGPDASAEMVRFFAEVGVNRSG